MADAIAIEPPDPVSATDDMLYEVVDGRIVEKPLMSAFEGWFASFLIRLLNTSDAVYKHGQIISEVLFALDPTSNRKRRPDVAFISYNQWPMDRPAPIAEAWEIVPELVIEVISKSNTLMEVVDKLDDYFHAHVQLVWVIMPVQRKIYVYRSPTDIRILQPGDEIDGGDVIPGFRLPVQNLFGPEPPAA